MNNREKVEAAYLFVDRMPRNVKYFCELWLSRIENSRNMDLSIDKNPYDLNVVSYLDLYNYIEYGNTDWKLSYQFWVDVEDWAEEQECKGKNNG